MTKSETAILKALDGQPEKTMMYSEIRKAAGLTIRGMMLVMRRLEDGRKVARIEGNPNQYTLTYGGMRALVA